MVPFDIYKQKNSTSEGQKKIYIRYSTEASWTLIEFSDLNYFTVKEAY